MKSELKKNGFLHLTNQTEKQLQEILSSLGEIIMTTDIVIKTESKGLVTTEFAIDFHTDHHSAKYIVWYCYKQTDLGGESLLIDAEKLYLTLPIDVQESLKFVELFEHKIYENDKSSYPFVQIDTDNNRQFHCSLINDLDKQNPSYLIFEELIKQTSPIKIRLQESEILIINNHRMFHGRTAISGSKDRFLKRFWLKN